MKAIVIKAFKDLQDPKCPIYQIGSVYEGDAKRLSDLESKGFIEREKPAPKPAKAKDPKKS